MHLCDKEWILIHLNEQKHLLFLFTLCSFKRRSYLCTQDSWQNDFVWTKMQWWSIGYGIVEELACQGYHLGFECFCLETFFQRPSLVSTSDLNVLTIEMLRFAIRIVLQGVPTSESWFVFVVKKWMRKKNWLIIEQNWIIPRCCFLREMKTMKFL
jgi:hypothetical protein